MLSTIVPRHVTLQEMFNYAEITFISALCLIAAIEVLRCGIEMVSRLRW